MWIFRNTPISRLLAAFWSPVERPRIPYLRSPIIKWKRESKRTSRGKELTPVNANDKRRYLFRGLLLVFFRTSCNTDRAVSG